MLSLLRDDLRAGSTRKAFRDERAVAESLLEFRRCAASLEFAILAYCLMPDHAHLLVEGLSESSDLRRFIARAKQMSGQCYSRRHHCPLWQEGYFDRVLRENDDAKAIARYVIANPIRAGLASNACEYPHVGSDVWTLAELVESTM